MNSKRRSGACHVLNLDEIFTRTNKRIDSFDDAVIVTKKKIRKGYKMLSKYCFQVGGAVLVRQKYRFARSHRWEDNLGRYTPPIVFYSRWQRNNTDLCKWTTKCVQSLSDIDALWKSLIYKCPAFPCAEATEAAAISSCCSCFFIKLEFLRFTTETCVNKLLSVYSFSIHVSYLFFCFSNLDLKRSYFPFSVYFRSFKIDSFLFRKICLVCELVALPCKDPFLRSFDTRRNSWSMNFKWWPRPRCVLNF